MRERIQKYRIIEKKFGETTYIAYIMYTQIKNKSLKKKKNNYYL